MDVREGEFAIPEDTEALNLGQSNFVTSDSYGKQAGIMRVVQEMSKS